jgi:tetratricopeptide (TPR) repeat protein
VHAPEGGSRLGAARQNIVTLNLRNRQEAQVQKFSQWIGGAAALAVLTMAATIGSAQTAAGSAQAAAPPAKAVKDQAEFDLFDNAKKDLLTSNGAKAITDLDAWKQHNPDSDFKDDREVMYVQAYQMAKQWDKVLEKAKELMAKDLNAIYSDPKQGPQYVLNILFGAVLAASSLPTPTPDQLAVGVDAAHRILDNKRKPEGIDDAAWNGALQQLNAASNALIYRAAVLPAADAQQKKDWATAEAAWSKAMADYPTKAMIPYNLGIVLKNEKKDDQAIWEFARAVAMDPTIDGSMKAPDVTKFVTGYYRNLHGGDDGLDQIEQQAKNSPAPPAGFHVESAQAIAEAKQKEFETSHPDIALWMKLKATLTSDQGQQYFDSGMKGAAVPELSGTVLEGKCRGKELLVAIPLPDATGAPVAEITLRLVNDAGAAAPLTGKAETGRITFAGVAEAFTKDPFMLTMNIEKKDIKDLKVTPCAAAAPARKGPVKKK